MNLNTMTDAEANVPPEWRIGDVILDTYEVKQIHEGGGMGLVYRVYHRGWNMDLAVKSPRSKYFRTEQQRQNFLRECETWINLGLHPHIVACHYVRTLGGIPRVFAEYIGGGSLGDWIRSRRLYEGGPNESLRRILDIAIQIVWGLQYAHEQGVIHQDVKPANVLMGTDCTAMVTDFGLSKARAGTAETEQGNPLRSVMVTPAYCSPEQANGEKLSRKTDIWSWGVSVLEMISGEITWSGGQLADAALAAYLESDEERSRGLKLSQSLSELLRCCLQRNPDHRPRDMEDVAQALKEIYGKINGRQYVRTDPEPSELLADGLNNRALSLLDIGRSEEAEQCWETALKSHRGHLESTYNLGLWRWRGNRQDEIAVLFALRKSAESSAGRETRKATLTARIMLEADDCEGVIALLEGHGASAINDIARETLLTTAKNRLPASRRKLGVWETGRSGAPLRISSDGKYAFLGQGKTIELHETDRGSCLRTFEGHRDLVGALFLSKDGRLVLSGSGVTTIKLWDVVTGRCLKVLDGYLGRDPTSLLVRCEVNGQGPRLLVDAKTGREVGPFEGHTDKVSSVCLSVDGKYALSGSWDNDVKLWAVDTVRCIRTFEGHNEGVLAVGMTPDGKYALSGGYDKTLKVWDVVSGRCVRTLNGHESSVTGVCLSADGKHILSGSSDHTLKLWALETGHCVRTIKGHADGVHAVSMTADRKESL